MIRRRLLLLFAVSFLLAGCPGDWLIADDSDNSNIITTARGGDGGGVTFTGGSNTGSSGGGSTPFSCTSLRAGVGVESDAAAGTNPSSVSLSDPIKVMPLYLGGSNVSMSVSNARTAVVTMASLNEMADSSMQATWSGSGVGTAYRAQSGSSPDEWPQSRAERVVREHAKTLLPAPVSASYRAQAGTTYATGAERTFKVLNMDGGAPFSVPTKAVHVYNAPVGMKGGFVIWVDQDDAAIFQGAGSKLQTIVTELRERIYKLDTCAFGSDTTIAENDALPASKRIYLDDDYVHFVFSRRVDGGTSTTTGNGVLGFFTVSDLTDAGFNRGKVLYIASSATSRSLGNMYAVIAHEFQHLLFSCHRIKAIGLANHLYEFQSGADAWLNEGLSMLAMMLNGYGPDGAQPSTDVLYQIADYLDAPSLYSMTTFYGDGTPNVPDAYGMVALFAQYLNDRLGDASLKEFHTLDNSATMYNGRTAHQLNVDSTDLVDRVLAKRGTTLGQLFSDFSVAVVMDGTQDLTALPANLSSRYQISNVNLRGTYEVGAEKVVMTGPGVRSTASTSLTMKPYSLSFLRQLNLSGTVSLGFSNLSGGGYASKLVLTR